MSELITHGFIQGHAATLGYFDGTVVPPAVFLSAFESLHGASPLIRIRFDLDNDDVYETVEMSSVMTTGGVDRVIEYLTNKPRFGSCDITLQNDDNRWSDFFSRSLTYSAGASKVRYHGKKGIVELGFDSFSSKDDTSWFPLFFGYISQKSEDAESRTVTISLLDEWSRILSVPLYKEIQGDSFFTYSDLSYVDNRMIGLGTYFGKHGFLFAEYLSKDNQLLVPCIHNQDDIDIT